MMIDPKGIMLGNYVCVEFNVSEVTEIDSLIVRVKNDDFPNHGAPFGKSECDPIPLSAQVLEACGFEKNRDEWFNDNSETGFIISEFSDGYAMSEPCKKGVGITSLHLLQNIYFIITGKPLEIDLQKLKNALK